MYRYSPVSRFGSYQLVSEPSILGSGGVNQQTKKKTMEEEEELALELKSLQEVEFQLLHEDLTDINKKMQKNAKTIEEILSMLKNIANGFQKSTVGAEGVHGSLHENRNEIPTGNLFSKPPSKSVIEVNGELDCCNEENAVIYEEVHVIENKSCEELGLTKMEGLQPIGELLKHKLVEEAHQVFAEIPHRDVIQKNIQESQRSAEQVMEKGHSYLMSSYSNVPLVDTIPTREILEKDVEDSSTNTYLSFLSSDSKEKVDVFDILDASTIEFIVEITTFNEVGVYDRRELVVIVFESSSTKDDGMVFKLYSVVRPFECKQRHDLSWLKWPEFPLPPPEPPPQQRG